MNKNYIIPVLLGSTLLMEGCQVEVNVPPNIIFLLSDDQRDNTFGAMGHPFVKTPNVDKLIKSGVWFSNTYIAEPVCSPSRVSLLTGMHERVHGVGFSSSYQLTEEQWAKTYPAILKGNGYYTGFVGKFGVEYYTFRGNANEKFDYWYGHDGWTNFFPKESNSSSCKPYHEAENDIITPIMSEAVHHFLDSVPAGQPFCLSVSLNVPHGSQTTSMYTGYDGWKEMSRPANENPDLKGHPVYDTLFRNMDLNIPGSVATNPYEHIPREVLHQDSGRSLLYAYDYNKSTVREHHVRYFQTITGIDILIGELMNKLDEKGMSDNTVIIFASDHGLLMGEYGMGGKALLYDLTSKIPCFIYDPRLPEELKGIKIEKLVSSLDIPVTILDYAGIDAPPEMNGYSLIPLMDGSKVTWRSELFLESLFTLRDNPFCEGIRVGDWKYIRMFDGVNPYNESHLEFSNRSPDFEQLFHLKDDPGEKNNLIEEYQQSDFLDSLRVKVARHSASMNRARDDYKESHSVKLK